ncbi:MAG: NUDIX hydrolase [Hyphomicrobium sp.]
MPVRKSQDGGVEVLLVTSRETGRWVIPKGWTSKRLTDRKAAAREALQEAGVTGKIASKPLGGYRYRKIEGDSSQLLDVTVYLLRVKSEKKRWPEQSQRQRAWFPVKVAARRVREARLQSMIRAVTKI